MSKRKKSYKRSKRTVQRDHKKITKINDLLGRFTFDKIWKMPDFRKKEQIPDDRRYFKPSIDSAVRNLDGTKAEYRISERTKSGKLKNFSHMGLEFVNPEKVTICKRRSKRRESLFKQRKIGKGRRVSPKRRYTRESNVRC